MHAALLQGEKREYPTSVKQIWSEKVCCQKCITPRNAITHVTCILPLLLHYMSMIRLMITAEITYSLYAEYHSL